MTSAFLGTDVDVAITASGVNLSTALEIRCELINTVTAEHIIFLESLGDIVVSSSTAATLSIANDSVKVAGTYNLEIFVTESTGKIRGLTSDVSSIIFS